jgi:DNA-directed RNA polymerase specialized sigma24 family protein
VGQVERLPSPPAEVEAPGRQIQVRPSGISGADLVEQAQQTIRHLRAGAALATPPIPEVDAPEPDPDPLYATGIGQVSFADLYSSTQRIAGSILRERLGMNNPDDVDDSLQAGYLKVWQKLQQDPDWLADKPKGYIVQAVVLRSKAQRYSHQRHYRKLVYDAEPDRQDSSPSSMGQVETWIDVQQALGRVAAAVEDQPVVLLALYNLITQVKQQDVARTYGCGVATLGKAQRRLRATLAEALAGYGPQLAMPGLPLPPRRMQAKVSGMPPVTQLIADWRENGPVARRRSVLTSLQRKPAAEVIPTLPAAQAIEAPAKAPAVCYPTGWGGALTLEQILTDPVVNRSAYAKARRLGLEEGDLPDCIQQGSIQLWQKLQEQPDLLVDKGPVWAGIYLAFSGDPKSFHRHYQRRKRFTDPEFDWEAADEQLMLGIERQTPWTQAVDERLDVAWFMSLAAVKYADEPRKLLSLYALTTQAQAKDVAPVIGLHPKNYAASVGNQVKGEVQRWWTDSFEAVPTPVLALSNGLD